MIVFTNGCFDILHRGHLELLEYCSTPKPVKDWREWNHSRRKVIVGLNSDKSVRRLKGEGRPINNQEDRKYILESLKFVDEVIIFEEDTPRELIEKINPDLIVKGRSSLPKAEETEGYQLEAFDHVGEYSTTNIIKNNLNDLPKGFYEGDITK